MIKARAAVTMLLSGSLTGCLPIPNVHYFAPGVSGIVLQEGRPVDGAEVRVTGQFSSNIQSAATNESGGFSVKPIRELRLTAMLLGDPLYGYTVLVVAGGKRYEGYAEFGMGDAPAKLQLACELSRPVVLENRPAPGNRPTYCAPVRGGR